MFIQLLRSFFIASILCSWLSVTICSSQIPEGETIYPDCEPRSLSEPGRLNIRADAKNFGTITPCEGSLTFYINPNSDVRVTELELKFYNPDDDLIGVDRSRFTLESISTGMFVKKYSHKPIDEVICRAVKVSVEMMKCFSADNIPIDCPDVRIIPPYSFHSMTIEDETLNICSEKL